MPLIRTMQSRDVQSLADTFAEQDFEYFNTLYIEHLQERCVVLLASDKDKTGKHHHYAYVRVVWESDYTQFWRRNIPEITDLYVHPNYRRQGIATDLISACEAIIKDKRYKVVGISVLQTGRSDTIQGIYEKLGYMDDGFGINQQDNKRYLVKNL